MSVINKMLRDLDKRQAVEVANRGATGMGSLRKGTASVGNFGAEPRPRGRQAALWGGALALAVVVGAGALWWMQNAPAKNPLPAQAERTAAPLVAPAATAAPEPVPPASAAVASLAPVTPAAPVTPVASAEVAAVPASLPSAPLAQVSPAVKAAPAVPAVAASAVRAAAPVAVASASAPRPAASAALAEPAAPAAKNPATAAAIDPVQLAQRQQQAGREALAHAQTLWTNGSRDLAIDLLQQAETAAERASQANPMPSNTQHLAAVVRELSRMLLAQGRASAALDMLIRVEPQLAGEPDIWALRANVAQRLGRHQDSVQAYTLALQSRPAEPRWLLGAAVSLAALGQTAQATDMAEKARLAGPISKEVQSYLRQMGVNLKE